ncbi:MAG: zinc-dependent peptidase, partial [Lewinella sp.]|nr:zinc-dependent peptidase [Lewinella sp.]
MDALLVILLGLLILGLLVWLKPWQRLGWRQPEEPFPPAWRSILAEWVHFYRKLSPEEQKRFEYEVQEFLLNYTISGVAVEVDETDRLLVAASAIIPIFAFPEWHYR